MKIIIIGAGIAGLTFAAACDRANMQVVLYDKASKLQNIGGGVILWPHALRYLTWLNIAAPLNPYYVPITRCNMRGTNGNIIFNEAYAEFNGLIGGNFLPIERTLLQQALCNQLSDGVLQLKKNCIGVQHEGNKVRVLFDDGSEDVGDVVIGADGIYSTIRKEINQAITPFYTNNCWWGGLIDQKDFPELPADEVYVSLGQGKTCLVWPTSGNRFMWYLPVKMPSDNLIHGKKGFTQAKKMCADWDPIVLKILNSQSDASQNFNLPIYALAPQPHWSSSHTTLIGDAAHALGPLLGQGANQAIEDAYILFNVLYNNPFDIPKSIQFYESLRYQKCLRLADLEEQSANMLVNDDIEALQGFEAQLSQLNLATIYQELIPLVNEKFCLAVADVCKSLENIGLATASS